MKEKETFWIMVRSDEVLSYNATCKQEAYVSAASSVVPASLAANVLLSWFTFIHL